MSDPMPPSSSATLPIGRRQPALFFIFFTILLDMLALGMILPILPRIVESFVGGNTEQASRLYGVFGTAWALMQFVFSPVLGAMSDRYGRRKVILFSNFGLGTGYVVTALAPDLTWLFVGRIIAGITSASIATGFAYVADVTAPEKRAGAFGKIGAAFGAGFVLGPAVGGLLGGLDPRLPFWVAAGFSFANFLYGYFILPESLPPERRMTFSWRRANPVGALRLLFSSRRLGSLATMAFLSQLAHVALQSIVVLYVGYRYQWDTMTVGFMLAAVGIAAMIVQGGLTGRIVAAIGERRALILGLVCAMIGMIWAGIAPVGSLYAATIPLLAFWGVAGAAAQGIMTRLVTPREQGRLQGASASSQSLAQLLGPSLFTLTFAYFISDAAPFPLPGAPFFLAAMLLALSIAMALVATRGLNPAGENP